MLCSTVMELLVIDRWPGGARSSVEEWVASIPLEVSGTASTAEPGEFSIQNFSLETEILTIITSSTYREEERCLPGEGKQCS